MLLFCVAPSPFARTGGGFDDRAGTKSQPPVLSVCEAIARRDELADRIVSVRGIVRGTMEGAWLNEGENCGSALITNGYKWDMVIWLETLRSVYEEKHADFAYDERAFEAVDREFKRKAHGKQDSTVVLTYTGLLYTYKDLSSHVIEYPNGRVRGFGFGHGGSAPVALLIKTVSDLQVLDSPDDTATHRERR